MGRRQGGPSRTGGGGSISERIRDRRATQPPAHFHRSPLGRGQLAVFPRCSLDPYDKDQWLKSLCVSVNSVDSVRAFLPPDSWAPTFHGGFRCFPGRRKTRTEVTVFTERG